MIAKQNYRAAWNRAELDAVPQVARMARVVGFQRAAVALALLILHDRGITDEGMQRIAREVAASAL